MRNLGDVPTERIEVADDPRVGEFRRLNDAGYRRQVEAAGPFHHGIILGEGWLVLERLLSSRYTVRSILVDEAKIERLTDLTAGRSAPRPGGAAVAVYAGPRDVIDEIVGFPLHRGVVAVADRGRPQMSAAVAGRARHLVVLEGVNDAENLGAISRTAAALHADGLLLDPTCADPLSRRSIRVSMGHVLAMPLARLSWPDGLAGLVRAGVRLIGLTPDAAAGGSPVVDISDIGVDPGDRVAILLGAEGSGLSHAALGHATELARIPMARGIDSLNVAAAAIACHALFRG